MAEAAARPGRETGFTERRSKLGEAAFRAAEREWQDEANGLGLPGAL